jgi:hypothetical protein
VLSAFVIACGGNSTTAPTPVTPPPTNIAGNWTGTFTFTPTSGGQRQILAVTATFTQGSDNITGQVNIAGGGTALLSGIVSATTLTASTTMTVNNCSGSASVSGSVSATQVRWTVPTLATSGTCSFFTSGDFLLSR